MEPGPVPITRGVWDIKLKNEDSYSDFKSLYASPIPVVTSGCTNLSQFSHSCDVPKAAYTRKAAFTAWNCQSHMYPLAIKVEQINGLQNLGAAQAECVEPEEEYITLNRKETEQFVNANIDRLTAYQRRLINNGGVGASPRHSALLQKSVRYSGSPMESVSDIKLIRTDYLSVHGANTPAARLSLDFVKYMSCCPNATHSYVVQMGRFINNPVFAPSAKYFAVATGEGPRPNTIPSSRAKFLNVPIPPIGHGQNQFRAFIPDGDGILLVQHTNPGQVVIPAQLAGTRLHVTHIERGLYPGIEHVDEGIDNFTVTYVGGASQLAVGGTIDMSREVVTAGKNTGTVVRLVGYEESDVDNRMWLGIYDDAGFDGVIYNYASSKLTEQILFLFKSYCPPGRVMNVDS